MIQIEVLDQSASRSLLAAPSHVLLFSV